jgi:hypothetical protein
MKTRKIDLKNQIKELRKVIAMNCLDCVCCQPKEVLACEMNNCPAWQERPKEARGLYILVKELKKKNLGDYEAEK